MSSRSLCLGTAAAVLAFSVEFAALAEDSAPQKNTKLEAATVDTKPGILPENHSAVVFKDNGDKYEVEIGLVRVFSKEEYKDVLKEVNLIANENGDIGRYAAFSKKDLNALGPSEKRRVWVRERVWAREIHERNNFWILVEGPNVFALETHEFSERKIGEVPRLAEFDRSKIKCGQIFDREISQAIFDIVLKHSESLKQPESPAKGASSK